MERRKFGNTGLETSILGFGGFHLLEIPAAEASRLLNAYLDAGGNYIETAASYGDGESEMKIGRAVSARRNEYILATKTGERTREGFLASLDRSLGYLRTDHVDLIIMHAVGSMADLDTLLGPGGAMEGFIEAKNAGKARFAGISMHGQPDVLVKALQRYPFDAVMTTVNYYDRFNFPEIEETLLPLANQKGTAVILMKPVADGLLWKSSPMAFEYAFSRPVSIVVTGINTQKLLEEDLQYAENYGNSPPENIDDRIYHAPELGSYVCRQCGKCLPCPVGINIPEIFNYEGYYDRQMANGTLIDPAEFALRERLRFWFGNRQLAADRYAAVAVKADQCTECGSCSEKCPYGIDIVSKLKLADYKLTGKKIY